MKFDIEKFDGNNDFGLWRLKMHALLVQNRLHKALRGKNTLSEKLSDEEKDELLEKAYSHILLFFSDSVLQRLLSRKLLLAYGKSWRTCTSRNLSRIACI